MLSHAPTDYACPFCRNIQSRSGDLPLVFLHEYDNVFVKLNPRPRPTNPGAALVVPRRHYENRYQVPSSLGGDIHRAVHDTALALKAALGCSGVTPLQNIEPDGGQTSWRYHVHVFPRFAGDDVFSPARTTLDSATATALGEEVREKWPQ